MPAELDCGPIPVPELLTATGWHLQARRQLSLSGLPASAAVATPAHPPDPPRTWPGGTAAHGGRGWLPGPGRPARGAGPGT